MIRSISIGGFQSTLPVGGATAGVCGISGGTVISIHAPRGGSDLWKMLYDSKRKVFQSTLPVGGATTSLEGLTNRDKISIHAPRGGSDYRWPDVSDSFYEFQSTLPVGGATRAEPDYLETLENFNPRSPWGERQLIIRLYHRDFSISIHAPRGGSDPDALYPNVCFMYFNPRSPWGERRPAGTGKGGTCLFQSTLPVGGATVYGCAARQDV